MSKCVSMAGEFSEHEPDGDHICQQCFALDEDALFAELAGLRGAVSRVRELAKQPDIDTPFDVGYAHAMAEIRRALDGGPDGD